MGDRTTDGWMWVSVCGRRTVWSKWELNIGPGIFCANRMSSNGRSEFS